MSVSGGSSGLGASGNETPDQYNSEVTARNAVRAANLKGLLNAGDNLSTFDNKTLSAINFTQLSDPAVVGHGRDANSPGLDPLDDRTALINQIIASRNTLLQARAQPGRQGTILSNKLQTLGAQ